MSDTTNIEKRTATTTTAEQTRSGCTFVPAVDIIEQDDELLLLADVPGARAEDIHIDYERGQLRLEARVDERQEDDTRYLLREYGVGDFVRVFQVGEGIDPARIQAAVKDGVLTVTLQKHPEAMPKKIDVRNG